MMDRIRSLRINRTSVGQSKDDRLRASVRYGANPSPRGRAEDRFQLGAVQNDPLNILGERGEGGPLRGEEEDWTGSSTAYGVGRGVRESDGR